MKRLIVNADDFGFTHGTNEGIIRAHQEGIVTSTTLMANGDAFDQAVRLAHAHPTLGVGCHLAAVGGKALSPQATSLTDSVGLLPKTLTELITRLTRGLIREQDIEHEFTAQVERLTAAGILPTHLDTHKHTAIHPKVAKAMAAVARKFNIHRVRFPYESLSQQPGGVKVRARRNLYFKQRALSLLTLPGAGQFKRLLLHYGLRTPDYFCGVALTGFLDNRTVCAILASLREGVTELMCHPALYDEELETASTRLKRERQREFEALTDAQVRHCVEDYQIELMSYAGLE
jgi:predicted glycoside hydrolase/deacetylase ChbG (UPF0249 family)